MSEVAGLRFGRGTIVGGDFHPDRELARFSPPNMPSILNLFRNSLRGEAINNRPFASPSFEVASHVKKTVISAIIINKLDCLKDVLQVSITLKCFVDQKSEMKKKKWSSYRIGCRYLY